MLKILRGFLPVVKPLIKIEERTAHDSKFHRLILRLLCQPPETVKRGIVFEIKIAVLIIKRAQKVSPAAVMSFGQLICGAARRCFRRGGGFGLHRPRRIRVSISRCAAAAAQQQANNE